VAYECSPAAQATGEAMSDQPIAPGVVEVVGRAIARQLDPPVGDLDPSIPQEDLEAAAEAAIHAADRARGLRVEQRGERPGIQRLVGPWVPA
jgi:hypothetical protein